MRGRCETRWAVAVLGAVSAAAPQDGSRSVEALTWVPLVNAVEARAEAARAATGSSAWSATAPVFRSRHYVIQTDLAIDDARSYGTHLDLMYDEYSRRLAYLPARGPQQLAVYAFRTRDDYLRTLAARWGIDGRGSGGLFFVHETGTGLAFWTESLSRRRIHHVLQHEGFHQFASSRFGNDLPIWLNEGLAEFFGGAVLVDERLIVGESPARLVERVRTLVEKKEHVPFERLLSISAADWAADVARGATGAHYHQSWSMVHFLVCADEQRYRAPFERYLRLVNSGLSSSKAFSKVFGDDVEAFERRWKAYALAARPSAFVTALERIEYLAEGAIALRSAGVSPSSLRELREGLREIDFTHVLNVHGLAVEIDAADDESFLIPEDQEGADDAIFVVSAVRRRSSKGIGAGDALPAPPKIETKGLEPRELVVEWGEGDRKLGYEIVAR